MYPIKLSVKSEIVPVMLIVAAWILSLYFYAHFPAQVASHWDFQGKVNGYSSSAGLAFGIPALLTGMYLLFLGLPFLDPKKERYAEFGKIYHYIKAAIILVLFGVYVITGLYNLGYPVQVGIAVPWLIGLLFIVLGNFMGKIKPNWFVGIRTPWTLSSENVWTKTHRFGGFMMMLFGVLIIISPLLSKSLGIAVFVLGIVLVTVGSFVYSYILFRQEREKAERMIVR